MNNILQYYMLCGPFRYEKVLIKWQIHPFISNRDITNLIGEVVGGMKQLTDYSYIF